MGWLQRHSYGSQPEGGPGVITCKWRNQSRRVSPRSNRKLWAKIITLVPGLSFLCSYFSLKISTYFAGYGSNTYSYPILLPAAFGPMPTLTSLFHFLVDEIAREYSHVCSYLLHACKPCLFVHLFLGIFSLSLLQTAHVWGLAHSTNAIKICLALPSSQPKTGVLGDHMRFL